MLVVGTGVLRQYRGGSFLWVFKRRSASFS